MKLIIDGREYPAVDHNSAELLHLMELQQQGREFVEGGLGMSAVQRMEREGRVYAKAMEAYKQARARGEDVEEPLIPDAALTMMAVTVFLTRRAAGDVVSFRDATRVAMNAVVQVPEPTDRPADDDAADPTTPGSDGPATAGDAAPVPPKRRAARSSSSTSRSSTGSPSSRTGGRRSDRGTSSASS